MMAEWGARTYEQWLVKTPCWLCGRSYEVPVQVPLARTTTQHLIRSADCSPCAVGWKFELVVRPDGSHDIIEGEQ